MHIQEMDKGKGHANNQKFVRMQKSLLPPFQIFSNFSILFLFQNNEFKIQDISGLCLPSLFALK